MKLKATISLPGKHFSKSERFSLAQMVIATNSDELHREVYENVLKRNLRVKDFGPAEYFTQMSDRMTRVGEDNIVGFDVTLSGVSFNTRRAVADFWEGLDNLHEIYSRVATEHLIPGLRAQLFTRMAVDKQVSYLNDSGSTTLLENGPTLIDGGASLLLDGKVILLRDLDEDKVIRAEAEALLGDKRTLEGVLALLKKNSGAQSEKITSNPERAN